jgi:hypothetical protein
MSIVSEMGEALTVAVEVPQAGDPRYKHWAKVVVGVDASKASGWAFAGDFIADGGLQDVPVGAVILVYGERGSRSNPLPEAHLYTANPDSTLTHHATAKGRAWARTLRDRVSDLLELPVPGLDLGAVPDEPMIEELRRRGYRVEAGDG